MLKKLLFVIFILVASPFLYAEEADLTSNDNGDAIHPIDMQVNQLMEKDQSTHGQIQALARGFDLWDAELNKTYKDLMKAYGKNEALKKALKEAQTSWLKFRDAEFEHLHCLYSTKDGSMYRIFVASDRMSIVKDRALQLRMRFDTYTESN